MLTSAFVSCLDACLDAVGVRRMSRGTYSLPIMYTFYAVYAENA
jgi:hypothetical protein